MTQDPGASGGTPREVLCGKDVENYRIHFKKWLHFYLDFCSKYRRHSNITHLGKVVGHLSSPDSHNAEEILHRMVLRPKQAVPERTFQLLSFRELDILVPHRFCALACILCGERIFIL